MATALPVHPVTLPSSLNGQQNGMILAELLVPTGVPNLSLVGPAARTLRAMVLVMMHDLGANLQIRGSGYRTLAGQWSIFGGSAARYEPCSAAEYNATVPANRKQWPTQARHLVAALLHISIPESAYWRKKNFGTAAAPKYKATAAVPGTSNHGWATAVDFGEEMDGDPGMESIRTSTVKWLIVHAYEFGWSAETQSEPWHWRYCAGDRVPQAVLDVEAYLAGVSSGAIPTPPPNVVPPTTPDPNLTWMENLVRSLTTLRPGARDTDNDSDVKRLQGLLLANGFDPGPNDGIYNAGGRTEAAVRAFQTAKALVVDLIVGQKTWQALLGA